MSIQQSTFESLRTRGHTKVTCLQPVATGGGGVRGLRLATLQSNGIQAAIDAAWRLQGWVLHRHKCGLLLWPQHPLLTRQIHLPKHRWTSVEGAPQAAAMVTTAAVVVISVGCVLAVLVSIAVVLWLCSRRRQRDQKEEKRLLDFPSGGVGIYTPMKTSLPDITAKTEYIEHIQPRYSFSIQRRRYSAGAISITSHSDSSNGSSNFDRESLESQIGTVCPALYQKKGTILRRESKDRNAKKCGQLQCSMYYDFKTSDLIVHVMQGKGFPLPHATAEDEKHLLDPYITLQMLPAVDDRKRQTSLHQQTQNPVFNEYFKFPAAFDDLKQRTLRLVVHDFDGTSTENPKFECEIELESVDVSSRIEVWTDLQPNKSEEHLLQGEMLISLNYLPTAERLTVGTIQAKIERKRVGEDEIADLYAKVALHFDGGRQSKRKRTSIKRGTKEPSWNESLVFTNIRQEDIASASLQIDLFERHLAVHDQLVGFVRIGPNAKAPAGREHWVEMLTSLRKTLPMWHPIYKT